MSQRPWDREEDDLPEELRPIADKLDEAAEEEQAILREAAAMQDAPGLARVAEVLEREWQGGRGDVPAGRGSSTRRWTLAALAVAAGIALFVFVRTREPDGPGPGDSYLGGEGFQIVAPLGSVDAFTAVEWTHPQAEHMRFVVRVLDPAAARTELLETPLLEGTRYALDPADTAAWPDEIVIEIEAKDASNRSQGLRAASASRSAH